ncbi:MAG TPA: MBL fold metallo-hydrolase [Thermoplasmatales archaeon]|nr:MBL fold metallo-hydrolase [Thermoplasmatales archaeon]
MFVKRFLGIGFESNVYLIKGDKNALVDTGTGFYSRHLIKKLSEEIERNNLEYVILTHEHFDHCGGVKSIKEVFSPKICIHENGAEVIEKGMKWSAEFFNAIQPAVDIDIKLKDGAQIDLGNVILKILYTPGHSKGSICIYEEESKSLFSGDTIFTNGGIGRTDFYGGNRTGLINSIKKISNIPVKNLYPGHGDFVEGNAEIHIKMAERNSLIF